MKYINKGDSRLPKTLFVPAEYAGDPRVLQSAVAITQNDLRDLQFDIASIKESLRNMTDGTNPEAIFLRNSLTIARRVLAVTVDVQVQQKHMLRVVRNQLRKQPAA